MCAGCFVSLVESSSFEYEVFVPQNPANFTNLANWHLLDALENQIVICGDEAPDQSLWFANMNGLIRYDGLSIEKHPYPENWKESFPKSVKAFSDNVVYIHTSSGVYLYTQDGWKIISEAEHSTNNYGNKFVKLSPDTLLIGTSKGLLKVVNHKVVGTHYSNYWISSLLLDKSNQLWFSDSKSGRIFKGFLDGLNVPLENQLESYILGGLHQNYQPLLFEVDSGDVYCLKIVPDGQLHQYIADENIWKSINLVGLTGSNNPPVSILHGDEEQLLVLLNRALVYRNGSNWQVLEFPEYKIPNTYPFAFKRNSGAIILGGRRQSVFEIGTHNTPWITYPGLIYQSTDANKIDWFISDSNDIIFRDNTGSWKKLKYPKIEYPGVIHTSQNDYLWIAGSHQDHATICYFDGAQWYRHTFPQLGRRISYLSVWEDENGTILFGCGDPPQELGTSNGGIVAFTPRRDGYAIKHIYGKNFPNRIVGIEKAGGYLWFGGPSLNRTQQVESSDVKYVSAFESQWTEYILADAEDTLWVAQWGIGVYRYQDGNWTLHNNQNSGLSSNYVVCLTIDPTQQGHILAGTDSGIYRFDGESWSSNPINNHIRMNRESGEIKVSQTNDLWINQASREWYFRDSEGLHTKPVKHNIRTTHYIPDSDAPIVQLSSYEEQIQEPGNVYFQWSGKDLWSKTPQSKLEYAYRLNQQDWSLYSTATEVLLPALTPGKYQLSIKARDLAGNESVEYAIAEFTIIPYLWKRPWFIVSMATIFLTITAMGYWIMRMRIRHILELETLKLQFFTNISHELRTPLMVILGPLRSLLEKSKQPQEKQNIELAYRNAEKMKHLVDEILDFRQVQAGKLLIEYKAANLNTFIQQLIDSDRPLADQKNQEIRFMSDSMLNYVRYDEANLQKVFDNLLVNAIKYSPRNSIIKIKLELIQRDDENSILIMVEDQGLGITKEKAKRIFDPFYRIRHNSSDNTNGTGLGLALTQSIIHSMRGKIELESPVRNHADYPGSRFNVLIPTEAVKENKAENRKIQPKSNLTSSSKTISEEEVSVLIVEDNSDIRQYLTNELSEHYIIHSADNGKSGWKCAQATIPNVIISDIRMPEMGGLELTRKLKREVDTSHIPVIILTALKSESHELEGLDSGADDYITKPVNTQLLIRKINNLLNAQKALWGYFQEQFDTLQKTSKPPVYDKITGSFIVKAVESVDAQIDNIDYDVVHLAKDLNMSRMTLYRKIKATTGSAPRVFIRNVRLKRAKEMLIHTELTISEISFSVGFNEVSYFGTCFKNEYGVTPTEFREGTTTS